MSGRHDHPPRGTMRRHEGAERGDRTLIEAEARFIEQP